MRQVAWASEQFDAFRIIGVSPSGEGANQFYRVSEEDALEAARTVKDAP